MSTHQSAVDIGVDGAHGVVCDQCCSVCLSVRGGEWKMGVCAAWVAVYRGVWGGGAACGRVGQGMVVEGVVER